MKASRLLSRIFGICMVFIFFSCDRFLDVVPSTQNVNPTTVKDFQEMLNSDSLGATQFLMLDMMSDDIRVLDALRAAQNNSYLNSYLWETNVWNAADVDFVYTNSYARILQMNIILDRLDAAVADENNTVENRSNVRSEALIHRAWYYFQLANAYGNAYDPSTAAIDLAVPLVLLPDGYEQLPRSTVQEVYTQIISDLLQAVDNPYLPALGANIIHPGKASGFALLARTYLYQGDYVQAEAYADSTLALANQLINYNNATYVNPTQLTDLVSNPEILLAKVTRDVGFYDSFQSAGLSASAELLDSLGTTDLRFTKKLSYGGVRSIAGTSQTTYVLDNSVAVPEVMLIKAECLARRGVSAEAGALLDQIRQNRIPASSLGTRTYTVDNILTYVLSERRKELFLRGGLRLFDLKRLNKEAPFSRDIHRLTDDETEVIATLTAGSNRYLLPFSSLVLAANPLIVQNPRDN